MRPDVRHDVLRRVPRHGGGAEAGDEGGQQVHGVGGADGEEARVGVEAGGEGVEEVGGEGEVVRWKG